MADTVKIRLTSMLNISFNHVLDTGIPREEWDNMGDQVHEAVVDLIFERAIDWSVEP